MTTAASSSGYRPTSARATGDTNTTAFAIPIEDALSIAHEIEAGDASETVHIGEHGLLGVQVETTNAGVAVDAVQSGSAAASAGVEAGAEITTINGQSVASVSDLNSAMAATHVGDKITIGWQDSSGQSHQAMSTLETGVG